MKKLLTITLTTVLLAMSGCNEKLWDEIDYIKKQEKELAERLAALEAWQATVNSNISALQGLVSALQSHRFITDVTEFTTPAPGGWIISFNTGTPLTITNGAKGDKGDKGDDGVDGQDGQDGQDGTTPQIGVRQDTDGIYYWTLNSDWLLDSNGQKIPVTGDKGDDGIDGQDGATPKVRINSAGIWEICAAGNCPDNAADGSDGWVSTGVKATGDNGAPGDDGDPGDDGATPKVRINSAGIWEICAAGDCPDAAADGSDGWVSTGVKAAGDDGADGADGTNGVTPQLRINATTNHWEVCTNGTCSADADWDEVLDSNGNPVPATGEQGEQGDAIFADVDASDSDYVVFTLADGGSITVPKYKALGIDFAQPVVLNAGSTQTVDFTTQGNVTTVAAVNVPAGWTVAVTQSGDAGTFTITAERKATAGNALVFVSDGAGNMIMRPLELKLRTIASPPDAAASDLVWMFGTSTLVWSDVIHVPECNKAGFDADDALDPTPDGRSYTSDGNTWYYYNFTYVDKNKGTLCPSLWRVPMKADFDNLVANATPAELIAAWGYGGSVNPPSPPSNPNPASSGYYWSNEASSIYGYCLSYSSPGTAPKVASQAKSWGFQVRCVK
jgi:hypothetical protein